MLLEQRQQSMIQLHLSDQQIYCLLSCDLYHEVWYYPPFVWGESTGDYLTFVRNIHWSPVDPTHKEPIMLSFGVFFVVTIKLLNKQSGCWWFEATWCSCDSTDLINDIWVRSRNCGCLVTWFCYQLIAKPGIKTAAVSWPDPYAK